MNHAICLLAYKDINYIYKFIDQFENYKDIYFYIHWHNHSKYECDELKKYSSNIKYVINKFNTTRFSFDLVYAELHLYEIALKDNMEYFHLMSESDFIICSPEYFCNYFYNHKNEDFIEYIKDERVSAFNNRYIYELSLPIAKASQWKSLCYNTTYKLINNNFNNIQNVINDFYKTINTPDHNKWVCGAVDEFIIPTVLRYIMYIQSESNKRYINWESHNFIDHPNILTYDLLNSPNYSNIKEEIICKNLIIRKIDIKNDRCNRLLDYLRSIFENYNLNNS